LGLFSGCDQRNKFVPPPPPEVTVQKPSQRTVETFLEYSGVLQAFNTVELRARVKGFLKERTFKAGDDVEANQLLLLIDETEFKARVKQAEAKLAEAQAALAKAKSSKAVEIATAGLALDNAVLLLAKIELTRQKNLVSRNAASSQYVDVADANLKKANAQVESDQASLAQAKTDFQVNIVSAQATIESADAQVTQAKIDLAYCRITAPTSGVISRSLVDPGNLVGDGTATLLATLLQEDQIYAYISISEADVLRFRKMRDAGDRADYRSVKIPLDLGMMNEKGFPHRGYVEYADPGVDPTTGTVQARGIFPNPREKERGRSLLPGAFVRVRVPFETKKDAILVPDLAVNTDSQGKFVLVVNAENKVERKTVTVGSEVSGERIVESGISPTDRVVVLGLQRARPGQVVKPVEAADSSSKTKKS
jgi:RND family efflux transporter MFP subunit